MPLSIDILLKLQFVHQNCRAQRPAHWERLEQKTDGLRVVIGDFGDSGAEVES